MTLETEYERIRLAEIYAEHKDALFHTVHKITNNYQMAEDVVHNTFEQLIKKNKDEMFALSSEDFRRRYIVIAKNKAIDLLRREKIYSDVPVEDLGDFASSELSVEVQIVKEEEYAEFRKLIAGLDDVSKVILEMKYVMNMSYKDIGVAVRLTPKQVDNKLMYAKETVRRMGDSWR